MQGSLPFGCGQCNPCRFNRRRLWSHRIMLESIKHGASCFVTLTYDKENYPEGGTLVPKHPQDWLKRLRKNFEGHKIRYFLVGEYGDESQRPHYHAAIFGIGATDQEAINNTWKKGFTYTGELTHESAQYIAGYVTKKMTRKDDERLKGRHPEFARMSLRPGIGATAMEDLGDQLLTDFGCTYLMLHGDIPRSLKHGSRNMPLGRYLRKKLRERMGLDEEKIKKESLKNWSLQMSELFENALSLPGGTQKGTLAEILIEQNKQKVLNLETKQKIYSKKGDL